MSAEPVAFFKKKKSRPTTARQREVSPPASSSFSIASASQVVLPSKKSASSLLSAGTKRSLTQREKDALELDVDNKDDDGPDVKWGASDSNKSHINQALDIIAGDEAEELLAKRRKVDGDDNEDANDDGQYHGQKAYRQHLKKSKEIPKAMRVGPQRSTNTIRTVTIIDYQPDVCKDYKETGYCGFGDTCKFLHDRGTYLAGWQLDKLAADPKKQAEDVSDSDDSDDEDIPFACLICRKHYTDPVVTRCGHYFCSACAIKRFAKTPKCAACGAPTGGIFNRADKVIEKVNKKKRKAQEEDDGDDGGGSGVEIEGLGSGEKQQSDDESNDDSDGS